MKSFTPFLFSILTLFVNSVTAQNNVGIGTTTPSNKLEVHGNLLITAPTVSTNTAPTISQTKTMISNATIVYAPTDSTGRFFDPGGPAGDYSPGGSDSYNCNIDFHSISSGIEFIIENIDIGIGDSLIVKTSSTGQVLLAIGNGYMTPGKYIFNSTSLHVRFKPNPDAFVGSGFSILFKRLYAMSGQKEVTGYSGNTFYFDAKYGSLRSGRISTLPNGIYSTATGYESTAFGNYSAAMGFYTSAVGNYSTAVGLLTTANGYSSTAMGYVTVANGYSGTTIGMCNDPIVSPQDFLDLTPTTPLFIIGNGDSDNNRSNAMVVRKDGHVGIGTNTPRTKLHVSNGNDVNYNDTSGYFVIGSVNQANVVFDNNEILARDNGAASDLYIQYSGGKVLIGTGSTGNLFDVNGSGGKSTGSMWSTLSDRRLKENIHPYSAGLNDVLKINPVWYQYNALSGYDIRPQYVGVIAQELQEVAPYMVATTEKLYSDGSSGYLQVDGSAMTYMLINAVKELNQEIEVLKDELMTMNDKQVDMKKELVGMRSDHAAMKDLINSLIQQSPVTGQVLNTNK